MSLSACPVEFVELAQRLADAGGDVVRRYFRAGCAVQGKEDFSPVTVADRETEQAMRAIIAASFPTHAVQGEEFGGTQSESDYLWVLDPIDGTRAFVSGKPIFAILIALLYRGEPILGVVDQPILRERWVGAVGHGTTFNEAPCRVRPCVGLADAVVNLSPNTFLRQPEEFLAPYRRIAEACKSDTHFGDAYAYGLLTSGYCDLIVENCLKLHDFAALIPVVTGAGGVMSDWQGVPLGAQSHGDVLAAGDRRVWEAALNLVRDAS